jgi:hypothetical protein
MRLRLFPSLSESLCSFLRVFPRGLFAYEGFSDLVKELLCFSLPRLFVSEFPRSLVFLPVGALDSSVVSEFSIEISGANPASGMSCLSHGPIFDPAKFLGFSPTVRLGGISNPNTSEISGFCRRSFLWQ